MAIHDWTRVDAGLFHHFHQTWAAELVKALNAGRLPTGYFALLEQRSAGLIPDVLTPQSRPRPSAPDAAGGVAVLPAPPPRASIVYQAEADAYVARANRIAIRNALGEIVAVIEIVSPGNKSGRAALRAFVEKSVEFILRGIHLLVVDLFPPTPRDPNGIHKAIWDEIQEEPYDPPTDKPLTAAAYCAGPVKSDYVEPLAVGDDLPPLPIFLDDGRHVPAPLEESYAATWADCPEPLRDAVQ